VRESTGSLFEGQRRDRRGLSRGPCQQWRPTWCARDQGCERGGCVRDRGGQDAGAVAAWLGPHRAGRAGLGDEDIATLDTPTLWSFPSCNSSPTQLPRHSRIQQTRRHCFGHNSFIRHQNGAFLDALERGRRRRRFGSGPSSRRSMDHSV
jgi:hypothetical protein